MSPSFQKKMTGNFNHVSAELLINRSGQDNEKKFNSTAFGN
jgi:hypothetical protein